MSGSTPKKDGLVLISREFPCKFLKKDPKNKSNVKSKEDVKSKSGNN